MSKRQAQPLQCLRHRAHGGAGGQVWPFDQDDRAAQLPRRGQFGLRTLAPRVFGHHVRDAVPPQQGQVVCQRERATVQHHGTLGFGQNEPRIDQPQQIPVPYVCEKRLHVLPANRQKHPRRAGGQGRHGSCQVGHMLPAVTGLCLPGQALQRQQGQRQLGTGLHRVAAHLRGKGVRGVDHVGDGFALQVVAQTLCAAKTPHPGGQGLGHGGFRASGVRKHAVYPGFGQRLGQPAGFGGATQQEDALHG